MHNEKEYKEKVYAEAEKIKTTADLSRFIDELSSFNHDYGTIVYACMAAMKAAFKVVNNSPQGGITGFQAGFLGWECIHEFMMVKPPCKLIDYNNMLYPQYADKFEKTISRDTWEKLQADARERIAQEEERGRKAEGDYYPAHSNVVAHWRSIAAGSVPFGYAVKADE